MRKTRTRAIRTGMLVLLAACMLCMSACGGKKAEITFLGMSDTGVLTIQYQAKSRISADEAKIRVSVSSGNGAVTGTVYCDSELKEDLEKGRGYVSLFDMTADREWTVEGSLNLNGAKVMNSVHTASILSLFGEDAEVKASFLIGRETVSEKTLEK